MNTFRYAVVLLPFVSISLAVAQGAPKIPLVKVESRSLSRTVPLTAELTPYLQTDIEARVPGYVEKVLVDRGSKVRRGELLVVLSAPEMGSQTSASSAGTRAARSGSPSSASRAARRRRRRRFEAM